MMAWHLLKKLNTELPCDPEFLFHTYTIQLKTDSQILQIIIAAVFIIAKNTTVHNGPMGKQIALFTYMKNGILISHENK